MSPGGQWILEAAKSQEAGSPWKTPEEPALLTPWCKVQQNSFQTSDLQPSNVINWSYLKAVGLWALGYCSHGVFTSQSWTLGSVNALFFPSGSLWPLCSSVLLVFMSSTAISCFLSNSSFTVSLEILYSLTPDLGLPEEKTLTTDNSYVFLLVIGLTALKPWWCVFCTNSVLHKP